MVHALGGVSLPEASVDTLVARAGGVPLHVEELVKAVREPGAAQGAAAIPATLADSLMARLDRLSTAKHVAQRAAVLGRELSYPELVDIAELDEPALRAGLARLVDAEILFARGEPPAATYSFKHALVQEAAYESLLIRTRQRLHGLVADALAKRPDAEPERVARHAEAAGRVDEAIAHYRRAGLLAQERSAHAEAILQLRHSIRLVGSQAPSRENHALEIELQLELGSSLVAARGYAHDETEMAHQRAQALCEALGEAAPPAPAIALSNLYVNRAKPRQCIELAERGLALSERAGDLYSSASARVNAGLAKHYQGRFAASLEDCEQALASECRRLPQHLVLARTDPRLGAFGIGAWNLWYLGHPDRALARAREGIAFARTLGDPFNVGFALFMEMVVVRLRGDLRAWRARASEVAALGDEQGFPLWRGLGRIYRGIARVMEGEGVGALSEVAEGFALASSTGNRGGLPALLTNLAEAQRVTGQAAEASKTVEGALAIATETGQHFHDSNLHRLQAELLLESDPSRTADAENLLQRALEAARPEASRSFELRAATTLARFWHERGRDGEARALLAPVYARFVEGLDTTDLMGANALLGKLGA
jgi:tetratricopeptide (TPR) repeat protein